MSGHRQNCHFSVFFGVFKKRALGNVCKSGGGFMAKFDQEL